MASGAKARFANTLKLDRANKPSGLPMSPAFPQPHVDLTDNVLTARLPQGDSVTVNLYGATVTSWKTSNNREQLFLSTAAKLDGSKPIRGGIPLVFPVFGPPPKDHATGKLPQHGFARNNHWEFLGKNSSESTGNSADDSVKLDFGLSSQMLDAATRSQWPYEFGLVYSVTLGTGSLETGLHVQNKGGEGFDFQALFHTYLSVPDISQISVGGLQHASYVDKVRKAETFTESSTSIPIASEVDRVYTTPPVGEKIPQVVVSDGTKDVFVISRDSLPDVTVWNGWIDKLQAMGDFEPKDGYKRYLCIEPGTVSSWLKLDAGDAWEGSAVYNAKL